MIGWLQSLGVDALFNIYVEADAVDPTINILQMTQGGLGLPDREYVDCNLLVNLL